MTQQRFEFQQHAIEIERGRPHHAASREHQQLLDKVLTAFNGLKCSPRNPRDASDVLWSSYDQFKVTADNGLKIVEIVSYAPGELPDNVHFLDVPQRRFRYFPPLRVDLHSGQSGVGGCTSSKSKPRQKTQADQRWQAYRQMTCHQPQIG